MKAYINSENQMKINMKKRKKKNISGWLAASASI